MMFEKSLQPKRQKDQQQLNNLGELQTMNKNQILLKSKTYILKDIN